MKTEGIAVSRGFAVSLGTRLLGAVFVVFATVTIVFWLVKLIPGDPVDVMLGPLASVSDAEKDAIRETLHLSDPPFMQYLAYLGQILTGNLGTSYQLNESVSDVILRALAPTAALSALALIFALALVILGVVIARTRALRAFVLGSQTVAATLPIFWVSYLLLMVFAFGLGWFPIVNSTGFTALVLPSLALALAVASLLGRVLHSSLEDARLRQFWLSVRGRGVSQLGFDVAHGVRHALGSVLPLAVQIMGGLLGGAVIVEQIFGRPGLGSVTLAAITNRDLPLILGIVTLSAVAFALFALIADIALWVVDPRVRPWRTERLPNV